MPRSPNRSGARVTSANDAFAENIDANNALRLLADAAVEREAIIDEYDIDALKEDSDEECASSSSVFYKFYNTGGSEAFIQMTNFDVNEFGNLWLLLQDYVKKSWNVGRGRKSKFSGKDVLMFLLTELKHGRQWDYLRRLFGVSGPTFERTVMTFIDVVNEELYESLVLNLGESWTIMRMIQMHQTFKTFKFCRYATNVTFQQAYRPSGTMEEGKRYFSGKHKLYGYKVEVSVLPNGLAIGCSDHYPGSVADIDIMRKMEDFHTDAMSKKDGELDIADIRILCDNYDDSWGLLAYKGYRGPGEFLRSVIPRRKPINGHFSIHDEAQNKKISSDRIIVENVFGRLCTNWNILSSKYRWAEKNYDKSFTMFISLTNLHIKWHPLRAADLDRQNQIKNRQYAIGEETVMKRRRAQEKYRAKRRRRLGLELYALDRDSDRYDSVLQKDMSIRAVLL